MLANKLFSIWKYRPNFSLFTLVTFLFQSFTFANDNINPDPVLDLSTATIVICQNTENRYEVTAARILVDEVEKRTGLQWEIRTEWPKTGPVIALIISETNPKWEHKLPLRQGKNGPENQAEGYRLTVQELPQGNPVLWIKGADARGLLFGVGRFLRKLNWGKGQAEFPRDIDIATAPVYPIRGHQIGYRATANSYDAWNPDTYEQYIRDLALFGSNCIENIPLHSGDSPLLAFDPKEMNIQLSRICAKYDLDYWVWTPATFDLRDHNKRKTEIEKHKDMYKNCPRLDGVFFPGGDPGHNHPKLIMPFLKELTEHLQKYHKNAGIWLSLQGFDEEKIDYFYDYIDKTSPDWLEGLVSGPGSPPIPETRKRLPKKYKLRDYPDITHSCRSQYPVAWWDPAYARTLGRECPNPQPVYYALLHGYFAPYTDGFLSYSDGIHDDVNKIIWSSRAWDPDIDLREVLKDYTRFFFRPDLAETAADGILALEKNWIGALSENGSVEATLNLWQELSEKAPELNTNWRWQLLQLRSLYDAYIRHRLLNERSLEKKANNALADAAVIGSNTAMDKALAILNRAVTNPVSPELRDKIEQLCQDLFESIGLQTSVKKYHAKSLNRGAILDYVDMPMNDRYWLEDEFVKIRKMDSEEEKLKRLNIIRNWENPGPGHFYDDLGTLDRSPHLVRGEGLNTDPLMERNPNPGYWYWDEGFNRLRLSNLVSMDRPIAVVYENVDVNAKYNIRVTGYRVAAIQINGKKVEPFVKNEKIGEFNEYHVPQKAIRSGRLEVTWEDPELTEIWLLKH